MSDRYDEEREHLRIEAHYRQALEDIYYLKSVIQDGNPRDFTLADARALARTRLDDLNRPAAPAPEQGANDFRMDELDAVMCAVDKWFDKGDPRLKQDPQNRAADAREIALQALERQEARAEQAERKGEEMRAALAEISKAEQSVAYSTIKEGESDFAERMTLQSMLRHCGDIARAALATPAEGTTREWRGIKQDAS